MPMEDSTSLAGGLALSSCLPRSRKGVRSCPLLVGELCIGLTDVFMLAIVHGFDTEIFRNARPESSHSCPSIGCPSPFVISKSSPSHPYMLGLQMRRRLAGGAI